MTRSLVAVFGLLALLSSCATIVSKSTWPVEVTTNPANAEVEIVSETGTVVQKGTTPFTASLKSGIGYFDGEKYTLRCSAPEYPNKSEILDTTVNGWYAGNIIFGGIIGFLLVDPMTGAMYRLPKSTHVDLTGTEPKVEAKPEAKAET